MTVYVVTSGSYSDYGIRAIFSSRSLADAFVREYNLVEQDSDEAQIEEWAMDEDAGQIKQKCFAATIWLREWPYWSEQKEKKSGDLEISRPKDCLVRPGETHCEEEDDCLTVFSPISQEHANKVAVEKYQEWLRSEKTEPYLANA